MLPLPVPEPGGSLEELRALINAPGDAEWRLLVGWLIAALRPGRPFPVLVLQGEQGSAKSTTGRFLRGVIDPARPPDRARPRDERDLAIAARNSWVLAYDNLSGLHEWLSDALCRLATGGGFATRKLYADEDEAIFDFCRPVMLNGIDELLMRPDLADRALRITLPAIPDHRRRPAAAVLAQYEVARPRILGALCDAVSGAICGLPAAERRITTLPRMADFAHWASAPEEVLGWPEGAFLQAYTRNRSELVSESLEDDPVASAVCALLADSPEWAGTAATLLKRLAEIAGFGERPPREWPSGPRALSGRLRRAAPLLRRIGIEWRPPKTRSGRNRDRIHAIWRSQPSAPSASAAPSRNRADAGQDNADANPTEAGGPTGASSEHGQPSALSPSEADGATGVDGYVHVAAPGGTSGRDNSAAGSGRTSGSNQARKVAAANGTINGAPTKRTTTATNGGATATAEDVRLTDAEDVRRHHHDRSPIAEKRVRPPLIIDVREGETEAHAEARYACEAARRRGASDRAEAERRRRLGQLEEAKKFEESAAEAEKEIAP
jgi:hypothetical protein